ncbi:MAG: hypothetical protein IJD36_03815 [Clostridia bacterium]|nr:hypothetical protein [Clostridia bacterium]
MFKWHNYYDEAAKYAAPYIDRAGQAADRVRRNVVKKRKRTSQYFKFLKFKQTVETAANMVLIVAALISLFKVVKDYIDQN